MKIKSLSKFLTLGILLNSTPISSFAGVLSEDTRYETFSGNDITVNNILEEDKVDMKIEGNTLVNLFDTESYIYNHSTIIYSSSPINYSLFKPNTTYTIVTIDPTNKVNSVKICNGDASVSWTQHLNPVSTFTTPSTFDENTTLKIYNYSLESNSYIDSDKMLVKNMIFEGDLTDNPPTEYIEGLKSSFEDQLVTQEMVDSGKEKAENLGKYKVEVKNISKNIFNINDMYSYSSNLYNTENSTLSFNVGKIYEEVRYIIPVKKGATYTFSIGEKSFGNILIYDGLFKSGHNESITIKQIGNLKKVTFVAKSNMITIRFSSENVDSGTFMCNNIQLEEGSVSTEYEPYKESVNTFYLNSPLLKVDTIEIINGQAYHIRKNGQVTLDGSDDEKWAYNCVVSNDNYSVFHVIFQIKPNSTVFSDKFINTQNEISSWNDPQREGIMNYSDGSEIIICIENSKLDDITISGLRKWLKENPVTVVYELVEPIYELIKADLAVNLFEGTSHISNNSNIPTNMEITVDRTINRAVEAIELATVNPTLENISKARMWTNLLKESIKKDELQSEINDITDIEDLQLERKTATSNVDIYVKSENMLLMSVSTNSITFEDFSGVEDMIKENAINISINSSLPYNLNAYLVTEIQNSDGTNIMDKDIFSIKESSELHYQTFSDVNNKLILKENCESGNNQKHNIDLKLNGGIAHEKDVYKTVIKFEAEQQ